MEFLNNIEFTGMFCMGAFVRGVLNYGLSKIEDDNSFSKIVTTIFGAAFSGVVFVFLELLIKNDEATTSPKNIYMYPLGLIMALLWAQIPRTIENYLNSEKKILKIIGVIHFIFLSALTIYIFILLFFGSTPPN